MPFFQLSQKSQAQKMGELVASLYHHSQGNSLAEFKRLCYQAISGLIPLGESHWRIEGIDSTWLHGPETKNPNTHLNYSFLCPQTGLTHDFSFSRSPSHPLFTTTEIEQLKAITQHLVEAFRLNRLSHHKRQQQGEALNFAMYNQQGACLESDEPFRHAIRALKNPQQTEKPILDDLTLPFELTPHVPFRHVHFRHNAQAIFKIDPILDVYFLEVMHLPPYAAANLTPKEKEVCFYLAKALSNAQIAEQMTLSRKTVENHLSKIYEKLNGCSRSELFVKLHKSTFLP